MDKNCILISKKEWEKLKKDANATKPDNLFVRLSIDLDCHWNYCTVSVDGGSFDLSDGLYSQIRRMAQTITMNAAKVYNEKLSFREEKINELGERIDNFTQASLLKRIWKAIKNNI